MSTPTTSPILSPPSPASCPQDAPPGPWPQGCVVHSCTSYGATLVIAVRDEIDHYTVAPLRAMLAAAADHGYSRLVLDTDRVTFCDSGLLRLLAWWRRPGRCLRIARPSPAVRGLLVVARRAGQERERAAAHR